MKNCGTRCDSLKEVEGRRLFNSTEHELQLRTIGTFTFLCVIKLDYTTEQQQHIISTSWYSHKTNLVPLECFAG